MTDRELLELAAKAAGHKIVEWTKDGNGVEVAIIVRGDGDGFSKRPWQPLHENQMTDSDGDALRLAVKLRLVLLLELPRIGIGPRMDGPEVYVEEDEDEYAATRLAITRAAAEIGKELP